MSTIEQHHMADGNDGHGHVDSPATAPPHPDGSRNALSPPGGMIRGVGRQAAVLGLTALAMLGVTALAPAAHADSMQSTAACAMGDGSRQQGRRIAGRPPRFEFDDRPVAGCPLRPVWRLCPALLRRIHRQHPLQHPLGHC